MFLIVSIIDIEVHANIDKLDEDFIHKRKRTT